MKSLVYDQMDKIFFNEFFSSRGLKWCKKSCEIIATVMFSGSYILKYSWIVKYNDTFLFLLSFPYNFN